MQPKVALEEGWWCGAGVEVRDPKFCVPKMAQINFTLVNFISSRYETWVGGGGGGVWVLQK